MQELNCNNLMEKVGREEDLETFSGGLASFMMFTTGRFVDQARPWPSYVRRTVQPVSRFWSRRRLIEKFSLAGGAVMVVIMVICGSVITSFVRSNVLYHRAVATALFVDSAIVRQLGSLQSSGVVTPEARAALDGLFDDRSFSDRIPYLDIWRADGTILYSNSDSLDGQQFPLPEGAVLAFEGRVVALETDLSAREHTSRNFQRTYTEIYTPVRALDGSIIAVSEVHEASADIGETLVNASIRSWASVGIACISFFLALFTIVWRASITLEVQERSLSAQLSETQALAQRNRLLGKQALTASRLLTEHNDHFLSTIGADLHDGPSQLVSFCMLKVEKVRRAKTPDAREAELSEIETHLAAALNDIRNIARGLVLPVIDEGDFASALTHAVELHRGRTGMIIDADITVGNYAPGPAVNICGFRFFQEGLNNAYRHGVGGRARVEARINADGVLEMRVISRGRTVSARPTSLPGIGLKGLKARIDALGGELNFFRNDEVSVLEMTLDVSGREAHG